MSRVSDRAFGFALATVLLALAGLMWVVSGDASAWFIGFAAVLAVSALAYPAALLPFNRLWHVLARHVAIISNRMVLAAAYYLVLLPTGVMLKVIGRDAMRRRFDQSVGTYFTAPERQVSPDTLRDQF